MLSHPTLRHTLLPFGAIAAILAGAACGGGGGNTGGGGSGGQGSSSSSTSSSSGSSSSSSGAMCEGWEGSGATCSAHSTFDTTTGAPVTGGSVTAAIVDEKGAPVAGQTVFICGTDICSDPSTTDAAGKVNISTTKMMKKPAFKYGDSVTHAELAIPLSMMATDFTSGGTGVIATARLDDKPGGPLTPGTTVTSGDVSFAVPADAAVSFDTIHFGDCAAQDFHAVNIPLANLGPVLAPVMIGGSAAGFELVYAAGPAETAICPAAKVTVALPHKTMMPNDLGWAAGTKVEFWIMTTDAGQTFAPYAGWAKMSDGTVSADGASVTTDDGADQGFNLIQTFAIRKKP